MNPLKIQLDTGLYLLIDLFIADSIFHSLLNSTIFHVQLLQLTEGFISSEQADDFYSSKALGTLKLEC